MEKIFTSSVSVIHDLFVRCVVAIVLALILWLAIIPKQVYVHYANISFQIYNHTNDHWIFVRD